MRLKNLRMNVLFLCVFILCPIALKAAGDAPVAKSAASTQPPSRDYASSTNSSRLSATPATPATLGEQQARACC